MKKLIPLCFVTAMACQSSLDNNVKDAMKNYDEQVLHSNINGITGIFTPDGELIPPGRKPLHGRDSIVQYLSGFDGIKVQEQKSTTDSIRRFGDTAFQYGKYYQRTDINNVKTDIRGMFEANWLIMPDGKLLLKRLKTWPVAND